MKTCRTLIERLPPLSITQITILLFSCLCVIQSGCQIAKQFNRTSEIAAPVAFSQQPTKEQLVQHIVSQTKNIDQLQSDIKVAVDGMPTLKGNIAIEKPNRLRLNAGLLGVTELGIDVGSNEDVFWFWTKVSNPGQEPAIFFARHDEYKYSNLQRQIPIEPGWLIDALGLIQFEPSDQITGPFVRPEDGRLELRTYRTVGNQKTLRKSVIDARYGWVVQQSIYDQAGRLIAFVDSKDHRFYPEYNLSLPGRIELTAYAPDGNALKLSVNAGRFKINSIYGDPNQLWTMPNPGDVPVYDLVNGPRHVQSSQSKTAVSALQGRDHRTSSNVLERQKSFIGSLR